MQINYGYLFWFYFCLFLTAISDNTINIYVYYCLSMILFRIYFESYTWTYVFNLFSNPAVVVLFFIKRTIGEVFEYFVGLLVRLTYYFINKILVRLNVRVGICNVIVKLLDEEPWWYHWFITCTFNYVIEPWWEVYSFVVKLLGKLIKYLITIVLSLL